MAITDYNTVVRRELNPHFTGDARRTYRLQRAADPAGPWTTVTAPPNGVVEHLDPAPLAFPAFYRIAAP